ncbi:phosphotransferase [Sphingosinicella soli]|uniref:Aminoglycoside phosphotransferase (APT) family kinase protein n=1 Tax=Sphingosinicella soli TaxID=333708 RepID=A0A7W7F5S9_9SPHN|nr:aminoglycoside phosphotransferase (APT) family kinase protein [Sphingosinicella soli]
MADADSIVTRRPDAGLDPRAAPTSEFIEQIRRRFPVETEMDRVLTRKMRLRSGPGYSPISLDQLEAGARRLISRNIGEDFTLSRVRWLTGGASKIQVAFDLEWNGPAGDQRQSTPMVLRMEPPESVVETSRMREFELIQALDGLVPVPPCYWVDADGECLPHPALIYGFVNGVTCPSSLKSTQVTGIGLNYGPELRPLLARQFLDQVGRFHRAGAELAPRLPHFDGAEVGSNLSVIRLVNWWRRVWEEDRKEDDPLVELAYQWLIKNAPPLDHVSIVHGDCRGGNFLFDEQTAQITGWLDWELALLGDRHQDLAWSMHNAYRHMSEDGKDELMSGFLPLNQYLEEYERLSGLSVDRKRLQYYRVLVSFMSVVICGGTGYRVARGGKTHQDVVVAWLAMITHPIAEQMRETLEEVL